MKSKINFPFFILIILNIFVIIRDDFSSKIMIFDIITFSILLLLIIINYTQNKFKSIDCTYHRDIINKPKGKINKKTSNDELLGLIKDFLSNKEDKNE